MAVELGTWKLKRVYKKRGAVNAVPNSRNETRLQKILKKLRGSK